AAARARGDLAPALRARGCRSRAAPPRAPTRSRSHHPRSRSGPARGSWIPASTTRRCDLHSSATAGQRMMLAAPWLSFGPARQPVERVADTRPAWKRPLLGAPVQAGDAKDGARADPIELCLALPQRLPIGGELRACAAQLARQPRELARHPHPLLAMGLGGAAETRDLGLEPAPQA